MHLSITTLLSTILATTVVSGVPSAPCNQNSGASYYCQDTSFYVCQSSTSTWLLQNVCDGDCCDIPAYAAYCPNCSSKPTNTKTTTKTTSTKTTTKSTSVKPTTTKTTTHKPNPTLAPGGDCDDEGSYACTGSNFLVCHNSEWLLQNVCSGDCCGVPAYAAYCNNCDGKPTTSKPKPTSTKPQPTTTKTDTTSVKPTTTKTTTHKPNPTLAPGGDCDDEGSYACNGSNFLVCHNSEWLLQNVCSGDCCGVPVYAAYCNNCDGKPTTSKPKPTSTKPQPTTTKTSTTSVKPTTTKTTTHKPNPTLAPGGDCDDEGSYACNGSRFLVCHKSEWLLQNVCSGDCCGIPAYAAYCNNCDGKPTTSKPKPTSTKPKPTTSKPKPTSTQPKPTSSKPDPTEVPGSNCGTEGRFKCEGNKFLVCQFGEWELQNDCGDNCCSVFQYAQYCYNC